MQPRNSSARRRVTKVAPVSASQSAVSSVAAASPKRLPIAARAIGSSTAPAWSFMASGLRECECPVTDDARLVAGSVAGVAQVDQLCAQPAALAERQQPVDDRRAARLVMAEGRVEIDDRPRGARVGLLRRAVRQEGR